MGNMQDLNYRKAVYEKLEETEPEQQGSLLVVSIGINEYQYWQKLRNAR